MRQQQKLRDRLRRTRFELFEERLAMSAQPVATGLLDAFDIKLEQHYSERTALPLLGMPGELLEHVESVDTEVLGGPATASLPNAHNQTGVTSMRNTYGLAGRGQTVAIIDSGIAYDHRALGAGFGAGSRVVGGWDFAENDANPYDDGPAGFHGTHVAGIVGSADSVNRGVASGVDLVALRVFDDNGGGNFQWVEQALRWVHDHRNDFANPITTVNMSLGTNLNTSTPPNWAMLEEELGQLKRDGIFVSVSAGNSFTSFNAPGLSYPASSSFVVPVSSVDSTGQFSSFSQRHTRAIAAPGSRITSTVPDFAVGGDGIANDFAAASGTSMAAPYVAGAAALVRQAMQVVGRTGINQDMIYEQLRRTADTFRDAITNADYLRLNVGRAISSLMPTDDYGSTSTTAFALGTLNGSRQVNGLVGTLADKDCFTFTAGSSGAARVSVAARNDLVANVSLVDGGGVFANGQLSFDAVAGRTYTVSLGTSGGIGNYTMQFGIDFSVTDVSSVESLKLADQAIVGSSWYQFSASRNGIMTVDAAFAHKSGDVNLELYDANDKLLGSSKSATNHERIDVTARQGQVFKLKVVGTNSDVDLRMTNLVTVNGATAVINGTAGNDTFSFVPGPNHMVTVNDVTYSFAGKTVKNVEFVGGTGTDCLKFTGTTANETVTLRPGSVQVRAATYAMNAGSIECVMANAGSGIDIVHLYDSAGNDKFEAKPSTATMEAVDGSFKYQVDGFDSVFAYASGGVDEAKLYDSAGNDRFTCSPVYAVMQGPSNVYFNFAQGFDKVTAVASTGIDVAYFYDSRGDDRFVATPTSGSMTDVAGTYNNVGTGFDFVYGYSKSGNDSAVLIDSAAKDLFTGNRNSGTLKSATGSFNNYAEGFRSLEVRSENGGGDTAVIIDVIANDRLTGRAKDLSIARSAGLTELRGFSRISAQTAAKATASAREVTAIDYIFQKVGSWK